MESSRYAMWRPGAHGCGPRCACTAAQLPWLESQRVRVTLPWPASTKTSTAAPAAAASSPVAEMPLHSTRYAGRCFARFEQAAAVSTMRVAAARLRTGAHARAHVAARTHAHRCTHARTHGAASLCKPPRAPPVPTPRAHPLQRPHQYPAHARCNAAGPVGPAGVDGYVHRTSERPCGGNTLKT
eukprot:278128-Chlamydomonas_euryale.AAC.4